jgi:hypothetical protein
MNLTVSPRGVQLGVRPTPANLFKVAGGFALAALILAVISSK